MRVTLKKNLFIYVFTDGFPGSFFCAHKLSVVVVSKGYSLSQCSGFFLSDVAFLLVEQRRCVQGA